MRNRELRNRRRSLKKTVRWLFLALFIFFVFYVFMTGDHGLYQIWRLKRRTKILNEEIRALRNDRVKLEKEKQLLLNDLDYIEKKAREEFGMVKEGERVYRVTFITDEKP